MQEGFRFADELGPAKVIHIHEPRTGLKAILVVDNVAAGPSIGGVRMAVDVSLEECFRLARAMTLKNAAAGLAHGGGKAVIFGDPGMAAHAKERVIRAFGRAIDQIADYIPGPDMGTNERCMAWVLDEIGRAVGLPPELGGIPLDQIGATGFGLAAAIDVAREMAGIELEGARVAVQGFGSVGKHAARYLAQRGAVLVAASDSKGTLQVADGIDIQRLMEIKAGGGAVADYPRGDKLDRDAIIDAECDIWIPAARPDVVNEDNAGRIKARLIAEGANIPLTLEAEVALYQRGVLCIPDFIANAGGVICAAEEYRGVNQSLAFQTIEDRIRTNVAAVLEIAQRQQQTPRKAAIAMARSRVERAMGYRRS